MSRKHYPAEYREQIVKFARAGRSTASLARIRQLCRPRKGRGIERSLKRCLRAGSWVGRPVRARVPS